MSLVIAKIDYPINSFDDLFQFYSSCLKFPDWVGESWDALEDALCDLSWLQEEEVVIKHHILPLMNDIDELSNYVDVLYAVDQTMWWPIGTVFTNIVVDRRVSVKFFLGQSDLESIKQYPEIIRKILEINRTP